MTATTITDPQEILRQTFGFSGFRGKQEAVVSRVLRGENTLAVMPTGAGKSLCYQLPALARSGTAIVISPLIALMHDQIRAAKAVGIRAAAMTSADHDNAATADRLRRGELDLLYIAPERATMGAFQNLLSAIDISLFAIDEAHCVSEWGHDFRPDYRLLRPLLDQFQHVPRLALTATADKVTREDILHQLGIPLEGLVLAGFDRPNIRYAITPRKNAGKQIIDFLARNPGAGIVYAPSRKKTETIAAQIAATGRPVGVYHAGLPPEQRAAAQAEFVRSEDMVMVATIAFGMGIDKPDVRFVIHAGLPKSLEAYYQETGRAGRDGDPAEAQLFWGATDFAQARQWLGEIEENRLAAERARLNALAALVETPGCRRAILLKHFGEDPPETCDNCDNCDNPPTVLNVSEMAQKLLSAVYRTGQSFGIMHLEKVLTGQPDDKVLARGHDRLSVFGIVSAEDAPLLRPVMRTLMAHEMLVTTDHGGLALGPTARPVLRGEQRVSIAEPPKKKPRNRVRSQTPNPVGDPLFDALRAKRTELAQERNVPPYVIFHDSVLRAMASDRPVSPMEMAQISGVGTKKLEAYGDAFLDVIRRF
ncbi:DNA helicase RecQ [Alterisphingorhabdus coralli]|uniref:DNA helicase RecQ n=1 Tax=Alterisphingorhabdus coralli TaxID=3071408 RepID=A0AA97I1W2_9SPHN|nr:DNA helicase RecQ [Parasphingorhabdus sp. SCSIO 66989]WOE75155.1 DNA helicase RecQ [Parasphingorhabdus sp. SCSIO 66989]